MKANDVDLVGKCKVVVVLDVTLGSSPVAAGTYTIPWGSQLVNWSSLSPSGGYIAPHCVSLGPGPGRPTFIGQKPCIQTNRPRSHSRRHCERLPGRGPAQTITLTLASLTGTGQQSKLINVCLPVTSRMGASLIGRAATWMSWFRGRGHWVRSASRAVR